MTSYDHEESFFASQIRLEDVRTHNLLCESVDIPIGALTVLTGVSGSGKSSLAFDTLHAEGQRRYLETLTPSSRQFLPKYDKPPVARSKNIPPSVAVEQQTIRGRANIAEATGIANYLRIAFAQAATLLCPNCQIPVRPFRIDEIAQSLLDQPTSQQVTVAFRIPLDSFKDRVARIEHSRQQGFLRLQLGDRVIRLDEQPLPEPTTGQVLRVLVDRMQADALAMSRLLDSLETASLHGEGRVDVRIGQTWQSYADDFRCVSCDHKFPDLDSSLFLPSNPHTACLKCEGTGQNVLPKQPPRSRNTLCTACRGSGLRADVLTFRWKDTSFVELLEMSVDHIHAFLLRRQQEHGNAPNERTMRSLIAQLLSRVEFLARVRLGYLKLNRPVRSLSTGEAKRVFLTTAFGAGLARALFVFDEPTTGLHSIDTESLIDAMKLLRDAGNTLVVVEHDPQVIQAADHMIELGPGAGPDGGRIVFSGSPREIANSPKSPTAPYLHAKLAMRNSLRTPNGLLRIRGAATNNLKGIDVEFPLGTLTAVAGVSGAGKSSLVTQTLYPAVCTALGKTSGDLGSYTGLDGADAIEDVDLVDSESIGRNPRANPVTYLKCFNDIRRLFVETSDAKVFGLTTSDFSFNRPGGRCETCAGLGYQDIDMQFLPPVRTTCQDCEGRRFQARVINVKCRGKNIVETLDLTVHDAFGFFRGINSIQIRLAALKQVGLDYLPIGQPLSTLSGGEAQRLKLAFHLASRTRKRTLFLLEEPTSGLHPADIDRLVECLDILVDTGHTVIVVEHNLQFLAKSDWIVEIGPGAAEAGGQVVAIGTPAQLARMNSPTGAQLARITHHN